MQQRDEPKHHPYTQRRRACSGAEPPILDGWRVTAQERSIVETLTRRVRLLTLDQAGRAVQPVAPELLTAQRHGLDRLRRLGLVETARVLAHPEIELAQPLASWRPGEPTPRFGAIAYAAAARWAGESRTISVFWATRRAAETAGGHAGRAPRPSEATHDIHVSALYLLLRAHRPHIAATWKPDSIILAERLRTRAPTRFKEKLPDAQVEHEGHVRVIEFAGAYSPERVAAFHRYCDRKRLEYELW